MLEWLAENRVRSKRKGAHSTTCAQVWYALSEMARYDKNSRKRMDYGEETLVCEEVDMNTKDFTKSR
jgi:hypothetical protein